MDAEAARPSFNDGALRRTLDDVGAAIDSFTDRLDKLSADIKQLEAYLDRSGIRIRVSVPLLGPRRPREFLAWEKAEPDRWRVVYFTDYGDNESNVQCPLIEAPVDVRLRSRTALPALLRDVAEAARTDDGSVPGAVDEGAGPPTSDDDIPF